MTNSTGYEKNQKNLVDEFQEKLLIDGQTGNTFYKSFALHTVPYNVSMHSCTKTIITSKPLYFK